MEIGITGGEEDGVDNTGMDQNKLYTQPEQVRAYVCTAVNCTAVNCTASKVPLHSLALADWFLVMTPESQGVRALPLFSGCCCEIFVATTIYIYRPNP